MNGQSVIEGSYSMLPPSGFFTRAKAAFAIAAELYPDDEGRRTEAAARLDATIYDALCAGQLVGRDPDLRLQIERRDLAGAMMLSACIISEADFNGWLAARGIVVAIDRNGSAEPGMTHTTDEMVPGPERDAAMLAAHTRYENGGVRNFLARTAADFKCSKTVVTRAINRARAVQDSSPNSRSCWDPFGRC